MYILGIDSGTGFSAMSIMEDGKPKTLPNKEGSNTTPSIVAFTKSGEILVGEAAKRQAITNPKNTCYEFKRLIGMKFSEIKDELKYFSYEIVSGPNDSCRIKVGEKLYSPEELTSMVLKKLKDDAEAYLGEKVTKSVITCPAYWNSEQRQCVKNASEIAGLEVLRVINEPTAAALCNGSDKSGSKVVAVVDAGSGTYDSTILEVADGVFEVKATAGDTHLGGKDYDAKIVDWLIDEFKNETGIDLSKDPMAKQRIKDEAEKAKIALSTASTIDINLPFISADETGPKHLIRTLSRAKFEIMIKDLNDRYESPTKQCIKESAVDHIDDVILVGGTTRIPSVQTKFKEIFGMEPSSGINKDECVSNGAAIMGSIINGDKTDILLLDVTPLDIGIETMGQVNTVLIPRNTTIPTKRSQVFSTAVDNQPAITVKICQGNRPMFNDNKLLGEFNLDGIVPAPRGVPQEEITIDIDANGIMNVSAKDLGTQKEAHITITSSSGLSKDEIEKAKAEAVAHEEEDKKRSELATTKNMADSLCFGVEKAMKDAGDKVTEDDKKTVNEAIAAVRESIKTDDLEDIKAKLEALNKANEPIAQKIYGCATPNFNQTSDV